jgi:hypothetical protein
MSDESESAIDAESIHAPAMRLCGLAADAGFMYRQA